MGRINEAGCVDLVTVEVWEGDTAARLLPKRAKLLRKIKGSSWEDCMRKHHELMGWEPYKPMNEL